MATLAGQLALNARRHPDRIALIFGDRERTYREFGSEIDSYANALLAIGITKGDRVAVISPNSDRFLIARSPSGKILKHVLRDEVRAI
ncbi:AMP-binding protein (plasmid) [Rhodococcus pyridinivorans]|uniref:AMP-binding protein n=1 Tax=Rhodococcus TaxID=1827 RepID=UPI000EB75452|nr:MULTISPECIES: AMP-binding protein [Rhodococcus]AXY49360.1 Long-chain-fatty-acid--CoA ligase [Rhodococcus ruber]MCT7293962.1 AMP-binding protein [Rhodococcus sp. PAE-6]UVT27783.1 AMP-binding protein [Rhodococcus pyridinivorans]